MSSPYQQHSTPPQPTPTNGLGLAGFILSVASVFTCGVTGVLGLILSLMGLRHEPKGLAIAGTIIGGLSTIVFGAIYAIYGVFILSCVGLAAIGINEAENQSKTRDAMRQAKQEIQDYELNEGKLPDGIEGNKLILDYKDAWDHEMQYELTDELDQGYRIRSAGSDGEFNTLDDILSDRKPSEDLDFEMEDFELEVAPDIEVDTLTPPLDPTPDSDIPPAEVSPNPDDSSPEVESPAESSSLPPATEGPAPETDDPFKG